MTSLWLLAYAFFLAGIVLYIGVTWSVGTTQLQNIHGRHRWYLMSSFVLLGVGALLFNVAMFNMFVRGSA